MVCVKTLLQVVLCTHAGRPKGEVVESMRIGNIGGCLGELLGESVACPTDCVGEKVEEQVRREWPPLLLVVRGTESRKADVTLVHTNPSAVYLPLEIVRPLSTSSTHAGSWKLEVGSAGDNSSRHSSLLKSTPQNVGRKYALA